MKRIAVFALACFYVVCPNDVLTTSASESLPTLEDEHFKTACGPIACLVALRSLGVDAHLDDVAVQCGWSEGELLPLANMKRALEEYSGIRCASVKLTPGELTHLLNDEQTVVILPIRKSTEHVDHAVCAVSSDENGNIVRWIDYPELGQSKLIGEVVHVWDGPALVVQPTPVYRALDMLGLFTAPIVVLALGVAWLRAVNSDRRRLRAASEGGCL